VRPKDYKEMSIVPRPGHADYTYQAKYGVRASSGGGRSSARETIGRVAAGAVADIWLGQALGTRVVAWVTRVGDVALPEDALSGIRGEGARSDTDVGPGTLTREDVDKYGQLRVLRDPSSWRQVALGGGEGEAATEEARVALQDEVDASSEALFVGDDDAATAAEDPQADSTTPAYEGYDGTIYDRAGRDVTKEGSNSDAAFLAKARTDELVHVRCPHGPTAVRMATLIRRVRVSHDSIGGVVTCVCSGVSVGLGEPCFDKLEASLAHGMMSLPATKGFEIGSGFEGTRLRGSKHNDAFTKHEDGLPLLATKTNRAGGTLGGISTGANLEFRVAVKSVSTIARAQAS
jgi:chorismate synthase